MFSSLLIDQPSCSYENQRHLVSLTSVVQRGLLDAVHVHMGPSFI